jgi:hypothetical protein
VRENEGPIDLQSDKDKREKDFLSNSAFLLPSQHSAHTAQQTAMRPPFATRPR